MAQNSTGQYLTFKMDKDAYAIEILRVREVLDYEEPTRMPRSPEFFGGIVNLRGEMLPVVDMRVILGVPAEPISKDSCIIITEVTLENEPMTVGLLADSVQQVITIPDADIELPPKIGVNEDAAFVDGIGKVDERFVMILNMDEILSIEQLNMVEELSSLAVESLLEDTSENTSSEITEVE